MTTVIINDNSYDLLEQVWYNLRGVDAPRPEEAKLERVLTDAFRTSVFTLGEYDRLASAGEDIDDLQRLRRVHLALARLAALVEQKFQSHNLPEQFRVIEETEPFHIVGRFGGYVIALCDYSHTNDGIDIYDSWGILL